MVLGYWQIGKPIAQFAVTWGDVDEFIGSRITSAKCSTCGTTSEITISQAHGMIA
jgi:hypothetical protein